MVAQSGIQDPELVTKKLSLLIDGTIVTAMVTGNGEVAHIGRLTAEDILRSALAPTIRQQRCTQFKRGTPP